MAQQRADKAGWRAGALAALALAAAAALPAAAQPNRVLSLNLCTDQLLLALADPAEIAGVTLLARDCRISAACAPAAAVPAVRGTAEDVVALAPRLVLGGPAGAGPAMAVARRLGGAVLSLPEPDSLDAIRAAITTVAAALGHAERGRALLADFDARLAAIPLPAPAGARPVAAIYQANGYTVGAGSLADAVLARAGLDNFATRHGLGRYGVVPLERLLLDPPDLLVTDAADGEASLAQALLRHPALRHGLAARRIAVPAREWLCGGPATLAAVARLTQARLAAEAR